MTEHERLAYRHLVGTAKAAHGRTDADAQEEAKGSTIRFRKLLSDDLDVLRLARDGIEVFVSRTRQRILNDHRDQIELNCCSRCGALARTPKARQCRFCRYNWHSEAETQRRNMRCLRFAISCLLLFVRGFVRQIDRTRSGAFCQDGVPNPNFPSCSRKFSRKRPASA
jgi:hypothetical protein